MKIDTLPNTPRPPQQLVYAATDSVPGILADLEPSHENKISMVASHLAYALQKNGHTLGAAKWAIHQLVEDGSLQPTTKRCDLPAVDQSFWSGNGWWRIRVRRASQGQARTVRRFLRGSYRQAMGGLAGQVQITLRSDTPKSIY